VQIFFAIGLSHSIQDKYQEERDVVNGAISGVRIAAKDMLGIQMENTTSHAK
jgi:hypothetical protein